VVRVFGLFGFGIRVIVENFHMSGKYESLSIELKMKVISKMGFGMYVGPDLEEV